MPPLHLERCRDGSFIGRSIDSTPDGSARQATWVFAGTTPEEIVAQWQDRYAARPHTLTLTAVERGMLADLLRHEARVVEATSGPPLRVVLLDRLATRLEALQ